ncbi:FAD-dependent oxidoreductase [Arthrobacter jiangjiafuii]|uniref:FAD-dependent oxidoreductase n=1 Tax=Arthrobacter jiangjiafuii TaxID=2817475 RepID=A0A975M5V0_9MICC|nr:FAD-dependent oxidoreductase [Arthrobacter jiangjiafuii]MBP3044716.1 FAD-dependent oxidoreductase [Arthrobacter jiangjiafuii]QWC10452.1 FAD-dependent oxidoreductase [Arthrobacter jiangjiafuii]
MALESVLIAGGGMAGFAAAGELRMRGFEGRLTIVDPEGLPYDRPPLSKDYLRGSRSGTDILLAGEAWYAERNIEVVTGTAVELRADSPALVLADGRELAADKVVLATGAAPRRLGIPGGTLDSVHHLRNRADADRLRSALHDGVRLVILGAGLIGAETASTAVGLGAQVTLIDPVDPPLVPAVGTALAHRLHRMHAERGIRVITGIPAAITADRTGHHIELLEGETVDADVVLVGIGIVPETSLAASAGLDLDDGILVDDHQLTSHPNIYAVGDSARTRLPDGTLLRRAEHWEHARNSGTTAAAALLGQELPVHGAPWFWSDRHGVHVEGVGSMAGPGSIVDRVMDGIPVAGFRLDGDGYLAGCAAVDGGLTVRAARRIINRRIRVDPVQLADPAVELRKLAR